MQNKQIPVYIDDFGDYDIRNIPLSYGMRVELVKFLKELQRSRGVFGSFYAIEAKNVYSKLISTLLVPLTTCLKFRSRRRPTVEAITDFEAFYEKNCQSVDEENLKQIYYDARFSFVPSFTDFITTLSIMCVLYSLLFISSIC